MPKAPIPLPSNSGDVRLIPLICREVHGWRLNNQDAKERNICVFWNTEKMANGEFEACQMTFASNCDLERHERTHLPDNFSEKKKYLCGWVGCAQSFAQKGHLKTHTNKHRARIGEWANMCLCGFQKSDASAISRHLKKMETTKDIGYHGWAVREFKVIRDLRPQATRRKRDQSIAVEQPPPVVEANVVEASPATKETYLLDQINEINLPGMGESRIPGEFSRDPGFGNIWTIPRPESTNGVPNGYFLM